MTTIPGTPLVEKRVDTPWLWRVRIATVFSMLLVVVLAIVSWQRVFGDTEAFVSYWAAEVLYLLILRRLLWAKPKKTGLPLAIGTGSLMFVLSGILCLQRYSNFEWMSQSYFLLFALTQAALVGSAIKAFRSSQREGGANGRLKTGIALPWILFLTGGFVYTGWYNVTERYQLEPTYWVPHSLHAIFYAEEKYLAIYNTGYSPSLLALGSPAGNQPPSPSAAGLIDDVLAAGRKGGFTFTYSPGAKDAAGRITSYTVIARPVEFRFGERTGTHNYFIEQTDIIHETIEDRPATVNDPAR